jgi:hypothetical protein
MRLVMLMFLLSPALRSFCLDGPRILWISGISKIMRLIGLMLLLVLAFPFHAFALMQKVEPKNQDQPKPLRVSDHPRTAPPQDFDPCLG